MGLSRLCELFERVGLCTNVQKTKTMTCTPGYISGQLTLQVYRCRMESMGESYREHQCQCVECSICGKDLVASSLVAHHWTVHGVVPQGAIGQAPTFRVPRELPKNPHQGHAPCCRMFWECITLDQSPPAVHVPASPRCQRSGWSSQPHHDHHSRHEEGASCWLTAPPMK
jgi:hypothetical protein